MDTDTATAQPTETAQTPPQSAPLPTTPCSVVWSGRHSYVLENVLGRNRWVGVDDRGRAVALSCAELQRRGWRPAR
jgi:hypothetical protein